MRRISFRPSGWQALLAIALAAVCGGQGGLHANGDGAQGGGELSSGGAGDGSTSTGEDGGASDGELLPAPDAPCDMDLLWAKVAAGDTGGVSAQLLASCGPDPGSSHALVFDVEGRLVDNTASFITPAAKEAWLNSLASYRWPCLAAQTIDYACVVE